jgi:hypothetical protein
VRLKVVLELEKDEKSILNILQGGKKKKDLNQEQTHIPPDLKVILRVRLPTRRKAFKKSSRPILKNPE